LIELSLTNPCTKPLLTQRAMIKVYNTGKNIPHRESSMVARRKASLAEASAPVVRKAIPQVHAPRAIWMGLIVS